MSGFPALRCFIFFATDLFILVLPSFHRGARQGFSLVYRTNFVELDEFVRKPREFCSFLGFYQPIAQAGNLGDAAATGRAGSRIVLASVTYALERYNFPPRGKILAAHPFGDAFVQQHTHTLPFHRLTLAGEYLTLAEYCRDHNQGEYGGVHLTLAPELHGRCPDRVVSVKIESERRFYSPLWHIFFDTNRRPLRRKTP
jgi:hypothetical protein